MLFLDFYICVTFFVCTLSSNAFCIPFSWNPNKKILFRLHCFLSDARSLSLPPFIFSFTLFIFFLISSITEIQFLLIEPTAKKWRSWQSSIRFRYKFVDKLIELCWAISFVYNFLDEKNQSQFSNQPQGMKKNATKKSSLLGNIWFDFKTSFASSSFRDNFVLNHKQARSFMCALEILPNGNYRKKSKWKYIQLLETI